MLYVQVGLLKVLGVVFGGIYDLNRKRKITKVRYICKENIYVLFLILRTGPHSIKSDAKKTAIFTFPVQLRIMLQ